MNDEKEKIEESLMNINSIDDIKYLFEKDENGAFIRLIIPASFVSAIVPGKTKAIDLRGKKDLDLTSEEVPILKIYSREAKRKINNKG